MNSANHHLLADALSAAELMGAGAVRSLDLLRDIDGTIDAVSHHTKLFYTAQRAFATIQASIAAGDASKAIPEDDLIPVLEALQEKLVRSYSESKQKMECAKADPRLTDDDGVVDAYVALLDSLAALNSTTEGLRWSILESNADAETHHTSKVLSDSKDIDSFLESL
ncbi:hypothetical protein BI292_06130 [Pseudomonas sp. 43NM1]|uniref:hypothetical protein n=1 Tax=Pseudomonas sp. 43NM1 TaxID=1904755 RepID=UPI000C327776|nr:hypothetical protein [Pseudomonas sp. 43NM1]PKH12585.1 hypothetical protein BI292_06130 [Pseudomonas sp. 43NM1]